MSTDRNRDPAGGPPQASRIGLSSARVISVYMYAFVAAFAYVGCVTRLPPLEGVPAFLPWLVLGVAIIEYPGSLFLEGMMLGEKHMMKYVGRAPGSTAEGRAAVTVIVVSAYGVSFAVYGLVLALLSFSMWPWCFYGLAVLHGIHLQLRWDRYEEAVRRATGQVA